MGLKGLTINTPPEMEAHIGAQDDRTIWESIFGMDAVLDVGNKLNAVLVSGNQLRIYDGVLAAGGAIGRIPYGEYEDVVIENGTQGQMRNDLVVAELKANTSVEDMKITYVKGTPGETAADPEYTAGNTYEGETVRQYPIYRIRINGLNVEGVDCLFEVMPNIPAVKAELVKAKGEIAELNSNIESLSSTGTVTKIQGLSSGADAVPVLIEETGWYYVKAINSQNSGGCAAYMLDSNNFEYIGASSSPVSSYVRAATAPILLKKGAIIYARSIHTDNGGVYRLST